MVLETPERKGFSDKSKHQIHVSNSIEYDVTQKPTRNKPVKSNQQPKLHHQKGQRPVGNIGDRKDLDEYLE